MRYDYLKEALKVLGAVIVILIIVSLIPNFEIKYKQVNILSDVIDETALKENEEDPLSLETQAKDLMGIGVDSIENVANTIHEANLPSENLPVTPLVDTDLPIKDGVIAFEDFSPNQQMLLPFYKSLLAEAQKRPIRIGVLGDSFIEADIMTADLRKQFQARFGGQGVGFIPIASPVNPSRASIEQESTGWTVKSMVNYSKADWTKFSLTGFYYTPAENATVTIKSTNNEQISQMSFAFLNRKNTKINVSINGQPAVEYTPEPSDEVQFLTFSNDNIQSLKVTVSNVADFTGIGFYRNMSTGIYVDNFSVRGSSGMVLSTINQELTNQLKKHVTYDLLIAEYGLNVMVEEKSAYTSYRKQMTNVMELLKKCYPNTPIILMSVGDRGKNINGKVTTHPGVLPMIEAQRDIAQKSGVVFWNTFLAMGGENSMVTFVHHKPSMAGNDYTHMKPLGGKKIAEELFESFMNEKNRLVPSIANEK